VRNYLLEHNLPVTPSLKKPKMFVESQTCEVCGVTLSSEMQAQQHYRGKNHLRNINRPKSEQSKVNIKQVSLKESSRGWIYCQTFTSFISPLFLFHILYIHLGRHFFEFTTPPCIWEINLQTKIKEIQVGQKNLPKNKSKRLAWLKTFFIIN
jgi:hypothetical protein